MTRALGSRVVAKASGQSGSWATGALGRPRCCLFSARCFPKWEGKTGSNTRRSQRAPWDLGKSHLGGRAGAICSPGCGLREQNRLQGGPSKHQHAGSPRPPALLWERAPRGHRWVLSALRKRWVSRPLHSASPWEFVRRGRNEARKGGSSPTSFLPLPNGGHRRQPELRPPGLFKALSGPGLEKEMATHSSILA